MLAQSAFEVTELCDALAVSRSAYYAWQTSVPTRREQEDARLQPLVREVFALHRRRYGARRIARELTARGTTSHRKKVRKIMEKMGLAAIQPKSFKPRATESRHRLGYSPNLLLEGIDVRGANQVWVGDITYVPLANRFAYLSLLMDLYSRKIVAWSLDTSMEESLVIGSLKMAIRARQPAAGLIHHTDRGGQYAGREYRNILARAQMRQSMSRAGDCYDNACMESCFGTIKTELEMTAYPHLPLARKEIQEYINYYNLDRRHSAIEYHSPNSFELLNKS
jgi:putative transposase